MAAPGPDDAPILCETCLGPNPFIRMTKEPFGKACKICERPFMIFRWKPADGRYKKTEICTTCAKLKNVCQTCVLDLQFGLPVQVRDTILDEDEKMKMPVSDVNRLWGVEAHERQLDTNAGEAAYAKAAANAPSVLKNLRNGANPYYKRNQAKICSFFVSGRCNRGDTCPYRHEMPVQGELANQNIRDRYYGNNDPVAKKLLGRLNKQTKPPETPADPTLTTLWLGNLDKDTTDSDVRSYFSKFGEISNIHVVPAKSCAFLTFALRSSAEDAAANSWGQCVIRGSDVRVNWGKRQQSAGGLAPPPGMGGSSSIPDLPPPPGMGSVAYPSMDPKNMNARIV